MENSQSTGKFVIVKDLKFSDFMKDEKGDIVVYDTFQQAAETCGMYEFEDVLIMQVMHNFKEPTE